MLTLHIYCWYTFKVPQNLKHSMFWGPLDLEVLRQFDHCPLSVTLISCPFRDSIGYMTCIGTLVHLCIGVLVKLTGGHRHPGRRSYTPTLKQASPRDDHDGNGTAFEENAFVPLIFHFWINYTLYGWGSIVVRAHAYRAEGVRFQHDSMPWLNARSLFTQQQTGTWWQHWGDKGSEERNWPPYLTCRWLRISVLSNRHSPKYESIRHYLYFTFTHFL